ncbi:Speract receptor [Echinococcus granulosus]|nr:Speract receptor [Echinococcus granulosus]
MVHTAQQNFPPRYISATKSVMQLLLAGILLLITASSNRIYLNGCGDSIVRDVFEKLLSLYAYERGHAIQVLGDFYELPKDKAIEEIQNPSTSSMMYMAFENLEVSNSADFITFPLFYAPYTAVVNIPNLYSEPGNTTSIRLTYRLLKEIFQGNVTIWNHSKIQALNPDLKLPEKRIISIPPDPNITSSLIANDKKSCFQNEMSCLHPPLSGVTALCYAIPYSIGFSSITQAELYKLLQVELVKSETKLTPTLPAVEAFVYGSSDSVSYPLVKKFSITIKKRCSNAGRLTSNVCKTAAELKRFLKWILTSFSAKEVLSNASCVRVDPAKGNDMLKSRLSSMECRQNQVFISVDKYAQQDTETPDDKDDGDSLDIITILFVTGSCLGILLLVFGVMLMRRFLNWLAEIRNDVWMIKELDIIPPESERLESFTTLLSQVSSRRSYSQVDLSRSCQCCPILAPNIDAANGQTISGIYKSISVSLYATRISASTVFDYSTRKTLIELRKIAHNNILRFYGLANLGDKDISVFTTESENEDWGLAPEDDLPENRDFALGKTDIPNYYVVREQCTGESIFFFMHCSAMNFPREAKIPVTIQLVDAVEFLHDMLQKCLRLHSTDVYLPSRFIAFLQKNKTLRSTSDRKNRTLQCSNMNGVMRLRWRPPECLCFELPLVKRLFSHPQNLTNDGNEQNDVAEEREEDGQLNNSEVPLSHFQDPTVDIYSLGVIINEVWSRAIPYSDIDQDYEDELKLLDAVACSTLKLKISSTMPEILGSIVSECTNLVPANRPNIGSVKKQVTELKSATQTGLDIYLDIMDKKMKGVEQKVANLDEEERCLDAVQEAIFREFLPKPLADRTLLPISHGVDEKAALEHCLSPSRYSQVTVCALRLLNFHDSTQTLPLDEVFLALNRLNRLMTTIVEEWKVLRISSFGTVMMIAGDPQGEDNDAAKQAISVADCALDLHNCLRCYGKVPRTEVDPEFAIALDTGAVAMVLRPGDAPALCVFGKVMQNARDILKFAAPKYVCVSGATKELLETSGRFKMELISSDTEFGEIYSLEKQKK